MEGLKVTMIDDDADGFNPFADSAQEEETKPEEKQEEKEQEEQEDSNIAEVDPDSLFESPESVGNEEDNDEDSAHSDEGGSTSPNDFFSSIATAFVEEGIFPDISDNTIKNIKDAKSLRAAIDEQIKAGLDEQQKRVIECLNAGVKPDAIRWHEGMINMLSGITSQQLTSEETTKDNEGEILRRKILYQDCITKGYSKERAERIVNKSVERGEDVEDAKEALENLKDFYKNQYNNLKANADKEKEKEQQENLKRAEAIKDSIMKDNFFNGIELDKSTREKAYEAISKPIFRDKDGEVYTALQKAELDDPDGFQAKLGIIYAVTNGFKDLSKIGSNLAKKEIKKGLADLESKINSSRRDSGGRLLFTSGVNDKESYSGIQLAI